MTMIDVDDYKDDCDDVNQDDVTMTHPCSLETPGALPVPWGCLPPG